MSALDVVGLYESAWYGRQAAEGEVQDNPRPASAGAATAEQQKSAIRRGSGDSLSDSQGGQEQAESGAGAEGEQCRRHEAATGIHQQAANAAVGAAPRLQHNDAFDDDSALGTWAGRQRIFSDHLRQQELEQEREELHHAALRASAAAAAEATAEPAENTASLRARGESPPMAAPVPAMQRGPAVLGEMSLDQEMNAAWRWRFTRKWQAEQMKQFEPPAAPGPNGGIAEGDEEEEWAEAMRLMDAVDGGLNQQIGRTLSLHNSSGMMEHSMGQDQSLTLMSPGLSQYMLLDGSAKESTLRDEASSVTATTQIVAVARKAQLLRRQQQEIERQVNERWEAASSSSPWVAQHLPAVQIDSWSSFAFVLVRLAEVRSQRQKLLVRGRNGASDTQAYASAEQEAARAAIAHRLPPPRVELVARGRMEWQAASPAAGQQRMLRIRVTRLLPPAAKDPRLRSISSASSAVAELARASFPSSDFAIVAEGETPTSNK